jgi:flavin reductase (DIM6/NTAB) family NADH-FMN oxidoreductase RutF
MDLTTLFKLSYGLYIVNSAFEGKHSGQIVNVVFQISAEPPTIATSINRNNYTHELISKSKRFSVMILEKDTPLSHIGRFGFKSGREIDKFEGLDLMTGKLNVPIIKNYSVG